MNRYLVKLAERLRPQQQEALDKLDESGGLILHHSMGSGKTVTFLTAAQRALKDDKKKRVLIVAPASLVTNVDKELDKHGIKLDRSRLDVYSYEKAVNRADELDNNDYSLTISDEAHKLRNNATKRSKILTDILSRGDKRILSTGTANYNHIGDLAPLVNIAAGGKVLPTDPKEFENKFLKTVPKRRTLIETVLNKPIEETTELANKGKLKKVFENYVHYYDAATDPAMKDKFPTMTEKTVDVEMSPEQMKYYKFVEGNIPFMLRMKVRHGLPLNKKEKADLNSFAMGVRQVSNSYRGYKVDPDSAEYTPKILAAVKSLKKKLNNDPDYRGLVYSNFLEAGVNEYSRKLKEEGIDHTLFTGGLSQSEKEEMVKDFNKGKHKVLVISSSGAEGLDLKGVRHVQILDQHWNKQKLAQVKGRARRYESHAHLPEEKRNVEVENFRSVIPKPTFGKAPHSIDTYMSEVSDEKQETFDKIKKLMQESN